MSDICGRAIEGDTAAMQAVADAISSAAAMNDDGREYQIAFALEATGEWEIIKTFRAADDAAANAYAEQHYADREWYVLDANGENING